MEHESEEVHLQEHGVKPTAVRILIWRKLQHKTTAFALKDVEEWMPEMDRSSIFRTLRLFAEHHLLHEVDDGMGQCKYCLCRCEGEEHHGHVHFTCIKCGRTYCLSDQPIPPIRLPENFEMQEVEYVIKGICKNCKQTF